MKPAILLPLLAAMLPFAPARAADWKPVEKVETYAISGQTAPELYASIGEKGPVIGKDSAGNLRRAIAHTFFKLTWQRDYDDKATGGACVRGSRSKNATPLRTGTKYADSGNVGTCS